MEKRNKSKKACLKKIKTHFHIKACVFIFNIIHSYKKTFKYTYIVNCEFKYTA